MYAEIAERLNGKRKNFVLTGEAGSGKTEVAINLALHMARGGKRAVHLFDMDQTKPLFRARGAAGVLLAGGVTLHCQEQYMDAPTVAPAVAERLADPDSAVVLDVGGGAYGSHMIGQFSEFLNGPETLVLYIVNPYRPWSGTRGDIDETMRRVLGAARLGGGAEVVANPNFGSGTRATDILDGLERLKDLLPERPAAFVCAEEGLAEELRGRAGLPVLPIRLYTLPEWMDRPGVGKRKKE